MEFPEVSGEKVNDKTHLPGMKGGFCGLFRYLKERPFFSACLFFILLKIVYLLVGYHRGLSVQGYEDLARLYHSYTFKGFQFLPDGVPWLPLHQIIQMFFTLPRSHTLFLCSFFQTIVSITAGITAALFAREVLGKSWRAGVATLAAWAGSYAVTIIGIGYLSEPLFHLEMFAVLYFGLRWMKNGGGKWRNWTILSVVAMQLTRYEGWVLTFLYMLILLLILIDSRRRALWPHYKGLWEFSTKDFFKLIVFISIVPLLWMGVNWILRGDPFFFANVMQKNFKSHVSMYYLKKIEFYLEYLYGAWEAQPLVIVLGLAIILLPGLLHTPAFLLLVTICTLTVFNLHCIMREKTAYPYQQRLSITLFVSFCPLFGAVIAHCHRRLIEKFSLKNLANILFALIVLVMLIMGVNGFRGRTPVLYNEMAMEIIDILNAELRKDPDASKPRVLLEVTDWDYSIILFYIDMDESNYVNFGKNDIDTPHEILRAHPSIRYIVLNHNQENLDWAKNCKACHLLSTSSMWDLYVYDKP